MAVMNDLRTFKNAAWLGWEMDANWTDPFLFAVYSVVKPLAGTLILVFMYLVVTSGETNTTFFSYMYVGNALYMFIADVLFGVTFVLHDDREHYMTLKQVYIAPIRFQTYIFGRSAVQIAITAFGVLLTLVFGIAVLGVDINIAAVNWPMFIVSLALGLVTLAVMGLALGGVTFLTAKHAMGINEGVAGIFYVFSGVVFPITILPDWAQTISRFLPMTYWMEGVRRGLEPGVISQLGPATGLQGFSDLQLILTLIFTSILFFVVSIGIFNYADRVARRKGKVDWTTAY